MAQLRHIRRTKYNKRPDRVKLDFKQADTKIMTMEPGNITHLNTVEETRAMANAALESLSAIIWVMDGFIHVGFDKEDANGEMVKHDYQIHLPLDTAIELVYPEGAKEEDVAKANELLQGLQSGTILRFNAHTGTHEKDYAESWIYAKDADNNIADALIRTPDKIIVG